MAERFYLLLPVHNRCSVTLRFAEALAGQTDREFVLLLLDDGSTDGTAEAVCARLPQTAVLRGNGNWWWAGCLQQGCRWLTAQAIQADDLVGILNDDIEIGSDFLASARAELSANPDTLLLARQFDRFTGKELPTGGGVHADVRQCAFSAATSIDAINCFPTRGLFLHWETLLRTGGFRPRLLPHYLSDYEFTWRAHQNGLRLRVAETFRLGYGRESTGLTHDDLLRMSRWHRWSLVFSRKHKGDPWAWIAFAWLTAPPMLRPWLSLKILGRAISLCLRPARPLAAS